MTLRLNGSTSGYVEIDAPATAGNNTIVLPSGNGSANQLLKNGSTAGSLEFSSSVYIDSSQRLLVGTSSSTDDVRAVFQSNPTDSTLGGAIALSYTSASPANGDWLSRIDCTDSSANVAARIIAARDGGTWTSGSSHPGRLVFSVTRDGSASPTEAVRIHNNGYTNVFSAGQGFHIGTGQGSGTTYELLIGAYSASGVNGGTTSIKIWSNGNVVNTNNSYGSLSDIKLKENIVDANSQWDDLKALQVRNYNFKEGQTHTQIGLIAQEVELVSPGLVTESPDRDEDGNDLGTVTKSVNYSVLYMKAVKALQEAMERIETLESRLTALEAQS
jgi:hypothetical protein